MFTSRQLKVFIAVVEEGSYRKASARLHLTVPPVFKMLKEIEAWADCKLFYNDNGNVIPNKNGLALYQKIKPLYNQLLNISISDAERGLVDITTDCIHSEVTALFSGYMLKQNVIITSLKSGDFQAGNDIHISSARISDAGNEYLEKCIMDRVMLWHSANVAPDLSVTPLVQQPFFYRSAFYRLIYPELKSLGYTGKGLEVENNFVIMDMLSGGYAATIDSFSCKKKLTFVSGVPLSPTMNYWLYASKNLPQHILQAFINFNSD